jgi:hypothetical protein
VKELTAEPNPSETKEAAKKPGAKRGRKPSKTRRRKVPAGRGAISLRNSVNRLVDEQSDDIAQALIDTTKAGNATVAHVLVDLTDALKGPPGKKKKRRGTSWAEMLANEPEWDPSAVKSVSSDGSITVLMDGTIKRDASKLPPSEPPWPEDDEDEAEQSRAVGLGTDH